MGTTGYPCPPKPQAPHLHINLLFNKILCHSRPICHSTRKPPSIYYCHGSPSSILFSLHLPSCTYFFFFSKAFSSCFYCCFFFFLKICLSPLNKPNLRALCSHDFSSSSFWNDTKSWQESLERLLKRKKDGKGKKMLTGEIALYRGNQLASNQKEGKSEEKCGIGVEITAQGQRH